MASLNEKANYSTFLSESFSYFFVRGTNMSATQLVILETLANALRKCPATKTLICDDHGKRDAIGYGRAVKFFGKVYDLSSIDDLSNLLNFYAEIPSALAIRGKFRAHVDLTCPVWRRKDERKYPNARQFNANCLPRRNGFAMGDV
jgi:hypothetical protein